MLTAVSPAGGAILAKDIVDRHREKTLALLWKIALAFQVVCLSIQSTRPTVGTVTSSCSAVPGTGLTSHTPPSTSPPGEGTEGKGTSGWEVDMSLGPRLVWPETPWTEPPPFLSPPCGHAGL